MQDPAHVLRMGGTQKRIVAGRGRDKLRHHCPALVAQHGRRDDPRIVFRNDAIVASTTVL
jgi:hypothetical protein